MNPEALASAAGISMSQLALLMIDVAVRWVTTCARLVGALAVRALTVGLLAAAIDGNAIQPPAS